MASRLKPMVPMGEETSDAALRHTPWRKRATLSSLGDGAEQFLTSAGFDRGPWLAVLLAGGIAVWFALDSPAEWVAALAAGLLLSLGVMAAWRGRDDRSHVLAACVAAGLIFALGLGLIWLRSEMVGQPGIERPIYGTFNARILERIEQPAQDRVRLVLATRDPASSKAIKVRVNLPLALDNPGFREHAEIRLQARLMPPAAPMLPGGYNFARTAWFDGLGATGSVTQQPELIAAERTTEILPGIQRSLSAHVRSRLPGAAGAIAATFASGDRGAISTADAEAMRDAGLTHLLSISGLHVSAVIAATYFLALKLLALWPWLTLRVRLPVLAAAAGAISGIGYTLLTGAEVPTVRSCVAAMLVLGALALGREPLSLRMVALAAGFVLLLWPESLVGPSFQMSFSAVIAIIALHGSAPVREFLAVREEGWLWRSARSAAMLLLTGLVIEIALMPIVLYHFHRAGIYGAMANVVAIPLVTFVSMPLIAIALAMDIAGLGAPAWWLVGKSLDILLWIARYTSSQPGAVKLMPQMGPGAFALFVFGGLWLALWQGRARLWGLAATAIATVMLLTTPLPDLLVSGDGRHVGITGEGRGDDKELLVLRQTNSSYTRDNLMELSGVEGEPVTLDQWPGAQCSADFCAITLRRAGRDWHVLMSRSNQQVTERALAAACERSDIVIADRWLPRSCKPRWLKVDRRTLEETGGLAIVLDGQQVRTVAEEQGQHGWWRVRRED